MITKQSGYPRIIFCFNNNNNNNNQTVPWLYQILCHLFCVASVEKESRDVAVFDIVVAVAVAVVVKDEKDRKRLDNAKTLT